MLISLILLATAIILDYLAGAYVTTVPAVEAPDLILDNIPTLDLDFIFLYGIILIIVVLLVYPLLFKIREFHRVISQFSLLIAVRAAFTTFTHLKIPAQALVFTLPRIFSFITFQNDLFFSGHTAVPFLGFLLFRHSKIKYFFLVSSIIMAAVVLFMHVHYTIDVFSAFFITYGTFKIGECFFKKISKGS
ncbi:MAG: sphingomyelin synthase family protein [Nanoarchaeota archaeon]|nr:sphingomyelin synthase family protein [Nanoarchaeota archaeon]MBU0977523.1 sphingomyelin synthase family protein [Nanoarchaeota archaeon]